MGLYQHEGTSDGFVFLRELITNTEIKAIRNFRHDVVMLEGIPDIPESLPHSEAGRERLGIY
jgi:hypothetical protein